jgi:hypothetical protein
MLTLTASSPDHGDWTPGRWTPAPSIAPGASVGWQSESDGIATGTEGTATYGIGVKGHNVRRHLRGPTSCARGVVYS